MFAAASGCRGLRVGVAGIIAKDGGVGKPAKPGGGGSIPAKFGGGGGSIRLEPELERPRPYPLFELCDELRRSADTPRVRVDDGVRMSIAEADGEGGGPVLRVVVRVLGACCAVA